MDLSWQHVTRRRMAAGGLLVPAESVESAVQAMVGAHAQVMSAAELSIALRTTNIRLADVDTARAPNGSLVRTYGPRGTIHLLARADMPLWCAALAALPSETTLPQADRLSADQQEIVVAAIGEILAERSGLDPSPDADELDALVVARTGRWAADLVTPAFGGHWPRWRQAIGAAARSGVLAFGQNRGNRVTYLDPGIVPEPDADVAQRWLLRKFLRAYGPATPRQFARWLGTRPALAAALFGRMADELVATSLEGETGYFDLPGEDEVAGPVRPPARLLPHFDPFVVGSFPRERMYPATDKRRAMANSQPGTRPVLLIDGTVAGIWSAKRTSTRYDVTVEPFVALDSRSRSELERDARRFAEFLGLEGSLTTGTVTAGAHL